MDGFPYVDLILLASLALFVTLRLRSVLGRKIGFDAPAVQEPQIGKPTQRSLALEDEEKERKKLEDAEAELLLSIGDEEARSGIETIKQRFPAFSATEFLEGAKGAFDMLFEAFAKGDRPALKILLADDIEQRFIEEMEQRGQANEKTETTLVEIESAVIAGALLTQESLAEITVRFVSNQVHLVRDQEGEVIEGDPSQVVQVEDEWTFRRDMRSRDPNWRIVTL